MKKLLIAVVIAVLATGCATRQGTGNQYQKEMGFGGAALGAIAGAVIGHQGDHSGGALRGALIGAAAGGLVGVGIGNYMDKQEAEFNQALAYEKRNNQIKIERLQNENLKITMNSEVSFGYDSAIINTAFVRTLDKVADILNKYPKSTIHIVGHTDSRGSSDYNYSLSSNRAKAVATHLERMGVAYNRISSEGAGESSPRASNETEAGRQLNRRVEMIIQPNS